ncbi:MAG TPA: T9SS type A sorting domain-containing protein [Cytophagaceae bacterium]|nr:T9SS type A sorting domain-containing protein [Cytophagaceae bacterium]
MRKLLLTTVFVSGLLFGSNLGYAKPKHGMVDKCLVSGGEGSLSVEADKSKMTITVTNEEGKLILSEVSSDSGKLQLLGLSSGVYEVEIKNKKSSKTFRVEVQ